MSGPPGRSKGSPTAVGRGRGQARPFVAADLAAVLATCHRPRRRGRGVESGEVALKRGRLDAVIAGLLFMAGLRRSEVSALLWGDVAEAAAGDGVLVTVRRGKTNPEGEARDVRFVKADVAVAVRTLRAAASPGPEDRVVPLSPQMVGLRFQAAARSAGVEARVTAHSARVGLASELTRRGASTTVMLDVAPREELAVDLLELADGVGDGEEPPGLRGHRAGSSAPGGRHAVWQRRGRVRAGDVGRDVGPPADAPVAPPDRLDIGCWRRVLPG